MADLSPLILLFEQNQKALASDFADAVSKIDSIDVVNGDVAAAGETALIFNGVSFVARLSSVQEQWPGKGPEFRPIFCNPDWSKLDGMVMLDIGTHVSGGERCAPIVATLLTLAELVGRHLNTDAVIWSPSRVISGFAYFADAVSQYQNGGPFPVLPLINFSISEDGGIASDGLAWLAGQEFIIEPSGLSDVEMMRRAVRISHDMASNGAIREKIEVSGLEEGEYLKFDPSDDTKILNVSIRSKMD